MLGTSLFVLAYLKKQAIKGSNVTNYQFWQHDNKPIELSTNGVIKQKNRSVQQNPVEAGLVYKEEEYVYSTFRYRAIVS